MLNKDLANTGLYFFYFRNWHQHFRSDKVKASWIGSKCYHFLK